MKIKNKTSEPRFINKNMIKCQQKSFKIQGKITKKKNRRGIEPGPYGTKI